jgi:hypothetical protein
MALGLSEYVAHPLAQALGVPRDTPTGLNWFVLMPLIIAVLAYRARTVVAVLVGVPAILIAYACGYTVASSLSGFSLRMAAYNLAMMGYMLGPAYVLLAIVCTVVGAKMRARQTRRAAALGNAGAGLR